MNTDKFITAKPSLDIKSIHSVYLSKTKDWKRDFFAPRKYDGIVLFLEGEIEYNFGFGKFCAKMGDILAFPGNLPYSGVKISDASVSFIVVNFECFDETQYGNLRLPIVTTGMDFDITLKKFRELLQAYEKKCVSGIFTLKSRLYELIGSVYEYTYGFVGTDSTEKIIEYIGNNIANADLKVSGICAEFFISESQLRRNIQRLTGLTPNEYINSLRLDRAKNMLCYSGRSIKEISAECGFASQYYFSKSFSRHFGCSPTRYRSTMGEG